MAPGPRKTTRPAVPAPDKAAAQKAAARKALAEKIAAERAAEKEAADKIAAETLAAEQAAAKTAADKLAAEAAAEKAAAEHLAAERVAAEAAEKAAAEIAATELAAAELAATEAAVELETVERFVLFGPTALIAALEDSVETFSELAEASSRNLGAAGAALEAALQGAHALGAQAFGFVEAAWGRRIGLVSSLAAARSLQDILDLQAADAQAAVDHCLEQMDLWTDTVGAVTRSTLDPVTARLAAA